MIMSGLTRLLRKHMLLSCKQATLLASRSIDVKLTLHERLVLKWHLFSCQNCTRYLAQITLMRDLAQQNATSTRLSQDARELILAMMLNAETPSSRHDES